MCIAIVKPKDIVLSDEFLKNCADNNPDGCGLAYCENGTIHIYKTLDFKKFLNEYRKVETKSNMLLHFRIATHGEVCPANCHPFKLNSRMVLIHNGVLSGYGDRSSKSDTLDFIDKVIGKISWKNWSNEAFIKLVGEAIGSSKFAVLDTEGNYHIVNENKGNWHEGVWCSNTSYNKKTYTVTSYSSKNYKPASSTSTTKSYKQYRWWEVDDDYDDPVYKQIYRCKDCGTEFEGSWYQYTAKCKKCNSYNVDPVGWKDEDGIHYYTYKEPKIVKV